MRLLFMGTPDFAVPSLKKLLNSSHEVAGVVTVPDKPKGRGQKLLPSAVKKVALEKNLTIFQPTKLDDPEFLKNLEALNLDLNVVVAFRILPEACFAIPKHGSINLHASLLPKYRGAAPIQRAIMNGEKKTGVTTFFLESTVDTGDILLQESIRIGPKENVGSVHDRLAELGAEVILKTVNQIEMGTISSTSQKEKKATPAPKIRKSDCHINWDAQVEKVHNQIRALDPYPGAFTYYGDSQLKIYKGYPAEQQIPGKLPPGTITEIKSNAIGVQCYTGIYWVTEVQPPGKRRMSVSDFLNGYEVNEGDCFG